MLMMAAEEKSKRAGMNIHLDKTNCAGNFHMIH